MSDPTISDNAVDGHGPAGEDRPVLNRLRQAGWPIAAAVLVFGSLAATQQLNVWLALVSLVIIASALFLVPLGAHEGFSEEALDSAATSGRAVALRRFADALNEPCILVDGKARVVHVNDVAVTQFPNLRNSAPLALALRYPAVIETVDAVLKDGQSREVELHQTAPAENWYQVTVGGLYSSGEEERPWMAVIVLHILTEQKRVEQMRADFVANASHEMRTPLTSLIGFVDTMMGPAEQDPESQRRFLGIMRTQAERLSKLVDDLMSLSRIELHQHVRPTGNVDLNVLLGEVAEGLQNQAADAKIDIKLDLPGKKSVVSGDRNELFEVFENLVDNAIKYGIESSTVTVALEKATRSGFDYTVSVTDTGPGVPAEHVPRLTERFYRVDAESSRQKKGTGLGLSIVKHIVQRHRGELTIESELGSGTRATVQLPR